MIGRLHVITDTRTGRDPLLVVDAALAAGAPVVQVRGKDLTDRALYELASRVVARCAAHGARCIVDDRVDVAQAVGAAGVHVGQHDLPVATARRLLGSAGVLGATARDPETGRAHESVGADYLGVGPAYATRTKDGLPAPLGAAGIRHVARSVGIPVIAIAGVTAARVAELVAAGAHGVAVIGAVSEAHDPFAATAALLRALDEAVAT
ncbi:MAG: thiamine phosphate synthase [Acidimicrobiales bacterium]